MPDVLEKVNKLLALATSSFEHEARTSAFLAVKLINEHKLTLSYPFGYRPPVDPTPPKASKPKKPKPPPKPEPRTRQELKEEAAVKCTRFLEFLEKKADQGLYPSLSLQFLIRKSVEQGTILEEEKQVFHYYLAALLRELVKQKILVSRAGSNGGYRLVERVVDPPAKKRTKSKTKGTRNQASP